MLSKNRTDARVYPRNLTGPLKEALEESPVVTIVGARQVGKSTLAQALAVEAKKKKLSTLLVDADSQQSTSLE